VNSFVYRPVIGVPTQTLQAIDGIPEELPHSWVMNYRYFTALSSVGAVPWMVPLLDSDTATLRAIFDRLDGVFIAGGVDLDPASYGEERDELCGRTDLPRDRVELLFTRWAMEEGKPVFGVCRGMQVINVAAGGTLVQDCTAHFPGAIKHDYFPNAGYARDYLAHPIALEEGTQLRKIFGAADIHVNSMHHQGIQRLGEGLVGSATAPDGLLEAVEAADGSFAIGVQWHPEMLIEKDHGTRRLFESFIDAASEFARRREVADLIA
jgi:putative glutamine amidotransferase